MSGGPKNKGYTSEKDTSCSELVVPTFLHSPAPLIINALKKGDKLAIGYTSPKGPIVALNSSGDIAGTILTKYNAQLISCMDKGTKYIALVTEVNGGNCDITIKSR